MPGPFYKLLAKLFNLISRTIKAVSRYRCPQLGKHINICLIWDQPIQFLLIEQQFISQKKWYFKLLKELKTIKV